MWRGRWCWAPGFYYTLYGAATLPKRGGGGGFIETALPETATAYGPVLCEPDKPVTFEAVTKPSDAAGFFSIGASPSSTFMP